MARSLPEMGGLGLHLRRDVPADVRALCRPRQNVRRGARRGRARRPRAGRLPDGSLYLEERTPDRAAGTIDTYNVIVSPSGERVERPYVLHVYSVKEWAEIREAGFAEVDAFGG